MRRPVLFHPNGLVKVLLKYVQAEGFAHDGSLGKEGTTGTQCRRTVQTYPTVVAAITRFRPFCHDLPIFCRRSRTSDSH